MRISLDEITNAFYHLNYFNKMFSNKCQLVLSISVYEKQLLAIYLKFINVTF